MFFAFLLVLMSCCSQDYTDYTEQIQEKPRTMIGSILIVDPH